MLGAGRSAFRWWFTNQATPSLTPGTLVTPGTGNAKGSATVIATSSDITEDVCGVMLTIMGGGTSAAVKNHLLDVGVDPAGGTSYDWRVQDLGVGSSGTGIANQCRTVYLPLHIPAGSQVAIRIAGNNATAGTVRVWAIFYGRPTRPDQVWAATYAEVIGSLSTSCGPAVTPGTSGAEGAWTNLGTCARRLRWLIPCLQMNDSSTNSQAIWLDVAINVGGTRQIILEHWPIYLGGTAELIGDGIFMGLPVDIPAGATIDVRLSISIATADGAYNVHLVGLG